MVKLLSIDVGIKNLAFCLFEKKENTNIILKWDIVNLSEQETQTCCENNCKNQAKFFKENSYYCLKHSKKQNYKIPTSETKSQFINKQKIQKLYEIAKNYNINYNSNIKKQELIGLINEYIYNTYFENVTSINASKIDLIEIGRNIKKKFDILFDTENIDYVIIENQISPIANRMKTIQGMIAQYFIIKNTPIIEFVSAGNKLKEFSSENQTNYSDRKKLGINKCLDMLDNEEWKEYFTKHKKKDDLADSYLQGIWYIKNKNL